MLRGHRNYKNYIIVNFSVARSEKNIQIWPVFKKSQTPPGPLVFDFWGVDNCTFNAMKQALYYDVAVLHLASPLNFTERVQPICLPPSPGMNYTNRLSRYSYTNQTLIGNPVPILCYKFLNYYFKTV